MSQNVYEQLAQDKKTLADKLGTNTELGNVVLALLGRLIIVAQERGKPIEGITLAPLLNSRLGNGDLVIRSKVTFSSLSIYRPAMWKLTSEFARYAQAKAAGLAQGLQRNPRLADFFEQVVEAVDQWTHGAGVQFGGVHVKQAILSNPGDVLVLKVGKNVLDD
jgi:hypothetical protein